MERERDTVESLLPKMPHTVHPLAREVTQALAGAVYPLSRDQLVVLARENEAPRMLVTLLSGLPARTFASEAEVTEWVDEAPLRSR